MNWTEFFATSRVALVLAILQLWFARGRKPGRLRREAVEAAQLAAALEVLGAPSALRDQARAACLRTASRSLATAKESWVPAGMGLVSIFVLAWLATRALSAATQTVWSPAMLGLGLVIAVLAWGVEWVCRLVGRRLVRIPNDASRLVGP